VGQLRGHLLLALSVTLGSAIPFVPTGEMVSGAAAVAAHSRLSIPLIFVITWLSSVLGDTILMLEARVGARKLRPWLAKTRYATRVEQAQTGLTRNAFNAIITGRLIPGGRTPVIVALGLSRFSIRRFLLADAVACALWAGIYSTIGSIGGRIAHHPIWAMVIAIGFAASMGVLVQRIRAALVWRRDRTRALEPQPRDTASDATASDGTAIDVTPGSRRQSTTDSIMDSAIDDTPVETPKGI
jgi:membrane protein DedA with SNARE-associated domain